MIKSQPSKDELANTIYYFKSKLFLEALISANKLKKKYPNSYIVWDIIGNIQKSLENNNDAIIAFENVILLNSLFLAAYYNLALLLYKKNEIEKSINILNKQLNINSNFKNSNNLLGLCYQKLNKHEFAIKSFDKELQLNPSSISSLNNKAISLKNLGKFDEAIDFFNRALSRNPENYLYYNNRGNVLREQSSYQLAINDFKKSILIKSDYAETHNNLGITYLEQNNFELALLRFSRAIELEPKLLTAKYNLGVCNLYLRNFVEGFQGYEYRFDVQKNIGFRDLQNLKKWDGSYNQDIFIWSEQGMGDQILFSSIIPDIFAVSKRLTVACDKRLIPLFENSFNKKINYVENDKYFNDFDFHLPIGSLPYYFRKSIEDFKKTTGYLKNTKTKTDQLMKILKFKKEHCVVGISWKSFSKTRKIKKNINLIDLLEKIHQPHLKYVSLQYGDVDQEISEVKNKLDIQIIQVKEIDNFQDITGLSDLIMVCDKVITIDNITAILSGALGLETIVLLPFHADWRWGTGVKSYWFNHTNLIRQERSNDWSSVFSSLARLKHD